MNLALQAIKHHAAITTLDAAHEERTRPIKAEQAEIGQRMDDGAGTREDRNRYDALAAELDSIVAAWQKRRNEILMS